MSNYGGGYAPRFKTIDEDLLGYEDNGLNNDQFTRTTIPHYHTKPSGNNNIQTLSQFSHMLKGSSDNMSLNEIFGHNGQNLGKMSEVPKFSNVYRNANTYKDDIHEDEDEPIHIDTTGVPRMKLLDHRLVSNTHNNYNNYNNYNHSSNNAQQQYIPRDREAVYNAINEIFTNAIMTKVSIYGHHSVWKCGVKSLLYREIRYIVAITTNDRYSIGVSIPLDRLQWVSFQTRTADKDPDFRKFDLDKCDYNKRANILDDIISLNRKTSTANLYYANNIPVQIEILRLKDDDIISETGTVASALDLFQTILTFIN